MHSIDQRGQKAMLLIEKLRNPPADRAQIMDLEHGVIVLGQQVRSDECHLRVPTRQRTNSSPNPMNRSTCSMFCIVNGKGKCGEVRSRISVAARLFLGRM